MAESFCAGTRSTAKGYVLLHQHRTFVGCIGDSELLVTAEADAVSGPASKVLSLTSDISGSEEAKADADVWKNANAALLASMSTSVSNVPSRLYATQVMSGRFLHFRAIMFKNYVFCEVYLL